MDLAAANGHLQVVKWFGRLDILQWLDEQLVEGFAYTAMECAAAGGHFDILKWLYEKHLKPCTRRALDVAVHGNLEVITRMPNAYSMSKVVAEAGHGNLEMVKWILAHGENLNIKSAMERAIVYKEPEIVFFLDRHRIDHEESFTKMRARLRYKTPFSIS
ncbi:hypothetical protein PHMEG_00022222 [Phytophthora megakarya]|uniref:Uncharacterized protein n=1 Tax=Phytophthora megakarya TaxID=4795 RepID=A0A225VKP9_9STRA|nr:hypothetical protein PHMEG_00022222 [Phytophthora megakarya]